MYLTSCLTILDVPIDDLIVAFCAHSIFRKSRKMAYLQVSPKFFNDAKTELEEEAFFYP